MISKRKLMSTILVASALLLITSPLAAALRSRVSLSRARYRSSAHLSHHREAVARHRGSRHTTRVARSTQARFHGQQSIDQARVLEIQQALIRQHYLEGDNATGEWDQATRDALTRFQGDNHWQTKILPDARALIKLGLGPSPQNLLNPESAAIAMPVQAGLDNSAQVGAN